MIINSVITEDVKIHVLTHSGLSVLYWIRLHEAVILTGCLFHSFLGSTRLTSIDCMSSLLQWL